MAIASRFGRQAKRSHGVCIKTTAVAILGLCFIFIWSVFSSSSYSSVTTQRSTFGEIAEPFSSNGKVSDTQIDSFKKEQEKSGVSEEKDKEEKFESDLEKKNNEKVNGSAPLFNNGHKKEKGIIERKDIKLPKKVNKEENQSSDESENEELQKEKEEEEEEKEGKANGEEEGGGDFNTTLYLDQEAKENVEDENGESKGKSKKKKKLGPLFDPKAQYNWKLCSTRSKHNYIPCIDIESATGRMQSYRHHERSCPKFPPMCLVPLSHEGYATPVSWPESKLKILYKNVAHPKLAAFIETHSWAVESGEYLTFPQNQSEFKGGIVHYLESIEEMVPDIEWGKSIRTVLDIGCTDSGLGASLLDKDVFTLILGLKDDLVDLAQVALERGFPAVVSPFASRRLPFPSGVFDAIHCGECIIPWHSNGGKLLLEMNRILRPRGYFILSSKHDSIEAEEELIWSSVYYRFAAALLQQQVWVMNVIPVNAPDTLPIIFERGLVGIYHDWCESFGTYPRSYDLLHADHLFSRLKNRCKQPVAIVVEMDRVLRPGGWAIIRDKMQILDPLEGIFRNLHWEIRMTFVQQKEGILCVQKTMWRP